MVLMIMLFLLILLLILLFRIDYALDDDDHIVAPDDPSSVYKGYYYYAFCYRSGGYGHRNLNYLNYNANYFDAGTDRNGAVDCSTFPNEEVRACCSCCCGSSSTDFITECDTPLTTDPVACSPRQTRTTTPGDHGCD